MLGREHPDTLLSANNLATLYQVQGRYAEAELLYRRVFESQERVLGREHRNTLASVNNLAMLYQAQGRYAEAEPLLRRTLEVSERVLGHEHLDTLKSINNLAFLYHAQGRYTDAEPLFRRALESQERVLGREHPVTIISVSNLAMLYQAQGRYAETEPLLRRALEQAPDRTMSLEMLDGFFTALVIGPTLVLPSQYLPMVWGDDGDGPDWDSPEQAEYVLGLLVKHWNAIAARREVNAEHRPIIDNFGMAMPGEEWAVGFMNGIDMVEGGVVSAIRRQTSRPGCATDIRHRQVAQRLRRAQRFSKLLKCGGGLSANTPASLAQVG